MTDAHLVLGRLQAEHMLGGDGALDMAPEAAHEAVAALGPESFREDRTAEEAALGMKRVLVPPTPGILSALGLLMADVVYDTSRAILIRAAALRDNPASLRDAADAVKREVQTALTDHGTPELAYELALRYVGQSYEVSVPVKSPITGAHVAVAVRDFHDRHRRRYGHADPDEPVEIVALRGRGTVAVSPPALPREPETNTPLEEAALGTRPVWFDADAPTKTTVYAREALHHGHAFTGPAVLHQYDTTVIVPPSWHARVDAWRNVWIER